MQDVGRAEWEAERRRGIGGSDVDDALSEAPYGCARRLGLDKLGVPADYGRENDLLLRRGNDLEPIVCARYEEKTGRRVVRRKASAHAVHEWARVNVDREILGVKTLRIDGQEIAAPGVGVLEVKTHAAHLFAKIRREGLPTSHILQLQWGMFVRGRAWGSYAVLNPETWELEVFDQLYDAALIEAVFPRVADVWARIQRGELAEKLEATDRRCQRCEWRRTCQGEALVEAHLPSAEREVVLERDESFAELLADREEAKAALGEYEALVDSIDGKIKERLGDRTAIECEGFRVYYRPQAGRTQVDGALLKQRFPDAYSACLKQTKGSRPLRVYNV